MKRLKYCALKKALRLKYNLIDPYQKLRYLIKIWNFVKLKLRIFNLIKNLYNGCCWVEDLMSPTFLILAASVGVAVVIVLLLLSLILAKLCRRRPGYTIAKIQVGLSPFYSLSLYLCLSLMDKGILLLSLILVKLCWCRPGYTISQIQVDLSLSVSFFLCLSL